MTETTTPPSLPASLRRGLVAALIIVVAAITLIALLGDIRELGSTFRRFDWWLLGPIFALTIWNYALRFQKWQIYLRVLDAPLPALLSARIFLAGFAMSLTPGKVGEIVKAIYVRRYTGAPVNRISAAVAAERITDALAMLILAVVGATEYSYGRPLLALLAVGGIAGIVLLQHPDLLNRQVVRARRLPVLHRVVEHGLAFVEASSALFRPRVLIRAVALGVVSWSGECIAFFLVLIGLGIDPSPRVLLIATFILAVSSLAGGASMIPGGLGVADASIAGLLVLLLDNEGMTSEIAAAATILIRFATLWLAVLLGALAMMQLQRRQSRIAPTPHPVQSPVRTDTEARG